MYLKETFKNQNFFDLMAFHIFILRHIYEFFMALSFILLRFLYYEIYKPFKAIDVTLNSVRNTTLKIITFKVIRLNHLIKIKSFNFVLFNFICTLYYFSFIKCSLIDTLIFS